MAVALDEDAERLAPFLEGITFPVLVDRDHVLGEVLSITNVPTVLWIDEHRTIVRGNTVAFGTDTFTEFHGIDPADHMELIRAWVTAGDLGPGVEGAPEVPDLDETELRARLLFRIGAHLARTGNQDAATERLSEASALVPHDFTVWRAALPLMGGDPFGEVFFTKYAEWEAAGAEYHGAKAPRA